MSYVIKSTGEKQKFNPNKIKKSILEAGASKDLAEEVVEKVSKKPITKYQQIKFLT